MLPPKLMDEEGRPEVQLLEPDEDTAAAWVRKRRFTSKKHWVLEVKMRSHKCECNVDEKGQEITEEEITEAERKTEDLRLRQKRGNVWEEQKAVQVLCASCSKWRDNASRRLRATPRRMRKEKEEILVNQKVFGKSQKEPTRGKPALLSEHESLMRNLEASRPVDAEDLACFMRNMKE